jgi:hypothetical protein
METQQMMEHQLSRMNVSMKEHIQETKAERKANQEDLLARME